MGAYRTSEEARQRYINAMGDELGLCYHSLWNELAWVYRKWAEFVDLFGTKPSRIDLMNRAAGSFFRLVQDSLWEDVLLHMARLTDRPRIGSRDNLTVQLLPELITNGETRDRVQKAVDEALAKVEFARDWRNRRIAHKDLALAMRDEAEPLKAARRLTVKEGLAAIANVLNTVEGAYLDSASMFERVGPTAGGAMSLLYVVDDGLRVEEERRERLKSGNYKPEDYGPRDL